MLGGCKQGLTSNTLEGASELTVNICKRTRRSKRLNEWNGVTGNESVLVVKIPTTEAQIKTTDGCPVVVDNNNLATGSEQCSL
jgi:hypothetical protein